MNSSSSTFLKTIFIGVMVMAAGVLAAIVWAAIYFRPQVVVDSYADSDGTDKPYGIVGKGSLLDRHPTRVLNIRVQRGGKDTEDRLSLAQVPLSSDELATDLRIWQTDSELNFLHNPSFDNPLLAYRPDWFPKPSEKNYLGSIRIHSDGWYIDVYRVTDDPAHVYVSY